MIEFIQEAEGSSDRLFELHMKEFESLRAEIFERLESQRQAFNYLITLLGAIAALIGVFAKEGNLDFNLLAKLSLLLPLIVSPLGFIFFDNEILIWSIATYIHCRLRRGLARLVGKTNIFELEGRGSIYLLGNSRRLHLLLSAGRWLLFFIPPVISVIYALTMKAWQNWSWWIPFSVILVVDVLLIAATLWAILASIAMRRHSSKCKGKFNHCSNKSVIDSL